MTVVDAGIRRSPLLLDAAQVAAADKQFLEVAARYWHPVAASRDVAAGEVVKVTLLGEDLALWRTEDGALAAVVDSCVHRGVRLTTGTVKPDGCLACPYHGWSYDTSGACVQIPQLPEGPIPATAKVTPYNVDEHGGLVWVCLSDAPAAPRPSLAEAGAPGVKLHVGQPYEWAVQSTRQLENFLDVAHFSHIHLDVFGNPDAPEVPPQPIEVSDGHLRTEALYPAIDPIAVATGGEKVRFDMLFRYDVFLPFACRLESRSSLGDTVLFLANQPVDAHQCKVWWVVAAPQDSALPDEMVQMMEDMVFGADQTIVETQRPDAVPLALTAELHLPFDKVAVAYRKALADMGFPLAAASVA